MIVQLLTLACSFRDCSSKPPQILLEFRVVYQGRPLHALPRGGIGTMFRRSHSQLTRLQTVHD